MVQSSSPQPAASPQLVGREFVRQYYTMMGEAPKHVYRFYSNESVYAFNGSDPVVGQQAVSERIESLNLKDCHTKIRVVDAHETLNRGVVVQVIGEISVNSGPLRRFAQTFVLALQTEKKYYVHNDTFRYLDELFEENVLLHDAEPINQDDAEQQTVINTTGRATLNGTAHPEEMVHVQQVSQTIVYASQQPLPPRNNVNSSSVARQEQTPEPSSNYVAQSEWDSQTTGVGSGPQVSGVPLQSYQQGGGGDTDSSGFEDQRRPESKDSSEPSDEHDEPNQPEMPTSWAGRVASGGKQVPREQGMAYSNAKSNVSPSPAVKTGPPVDNTYKGAPSSSVRSTDVNNSHPPRASPAPSSSSATGSGRVPSARYGVPSARPISDAASDELQVFVGSLPEDIKEHELRTCFSSCGNVMDVRLRTRNSQLASGRPFPSFAFVVFDSVETVNKVMEKRDFTIRGGHPITVEPKRPDEKTHREDGGRGQRGGERMDRDRQGGPGGQRGYRGGGGGGPNRGFRGGGGGGGGGPGRGGGGSGSRMFTPRHPPHHNYPPTGGGGGGGGGGNPAHTPIQPKS